MEEPGIASKAAPEVAGQLGRREASSALPQACNLLICLRLLPLLILEVRRILCVDSIVRIVC